MQKKNIQTEFLPNKSSWLSDKLDEESILLIRNILVKQQVKARIEEGGTTPNIDGYIELLDNEERIIGKLTVQVKHLPKLTNNVNVSYSIPQSLLAYAERIKGEVVVFMTCDTDNGIVYWKYIDEDFIRKCKNKRDDIQETYVYHFASQENLTKKNAREVILEWIRIYIEKKKSITDDIKRCHEFIALHKHVFDSIHAEFFKLPDSHISRKETDILFNWIKEDLSKDESPVKLLVGKAGVGKSVVIKGVIRKLENEGIVNMAIKADCSNVTNDEINGLSLQTLQRSIDMISAGRDKIVLIIDQIDALSQYLSNDRSKLNNLLNIVNTLQEKRLKDVRIVISCRQYDLEYDAALKSLKATSSVIELSTLTTDEVKGIISRLDANLPSKMSEQTLKTLSVPQYLDIFCRIYIRNDTRYEYNNHIELYNELWEHLLSNVPTNVSAERIESCLYKISCTIKAADTLNPTWITKAADYSLISYLASEGVVVLENHRISFFHQSFYDYVLARYYVTTKKSFINELPDLFQGLELRSTVKLFLDFERAFSDEMYRKDLETIIFSDRIRGHIKQLALSVVAYSEGIRGYEKKIVKRLYKYDWRLFAFFISSTISDDQWFYMIEELIEPLLPEMTLKSEMYSSVASFLCNNASAHADAVYGLIDEIKDEDTKLRLVGWIMHWHNDYLSEKVRAWYFKMKKKDKSNLAFYVHDAIKTNLNFALYETENLLFDYLISDNKAKKEHDDYVLIEQLCKDLYDNHPKAFLMLLYRCFTKVVKNKRVPVSYRGYFCNSVFKSYQHDYIELIYEWLGTLLEQYAIKDPSFVKLSVKELLYLNDEMSLSLAFRTISSNPRSFDKDIWEILTDNSKIDRYLEESEFKYYFLNMLKNWYSTLSSEKIVFYQYLLLNFKSGKDWLSDKERHFSNMIYWHLWRRKWMLICCTLPSDGLMPSLRKCKQELIRRFGYEYENEKTNHHVSCAHICGGIVSKEQYKRFSIKMWRNAFRLKESISNGKYRPFDERVQAKTFMSCVEERPEYFKNFIFEIFGDKQTSDSYKVNGLLGLLSSGCDIIELIPLFRRFLVIEYIQSNPHDFEQMAKYYTKKENIILNEMILILVKVINKPFQPQKIYVDSGCDQLERLVNNMLMDAINSPQGIALQILIEICSVTARRTQIYQLLMSLQVGLSEELKLQVISFISSKEYYDEELFDKLYPVLISNMGSSALLINTNAIQYYYYNTNRPFINEYINKIMSDENSHVLLSQIFFYGTARQDEEIASKCSDNLEKILSFDNESVIAKIVEVSMKSLSYTEFSSLSKVILLRYAGDSRKDVIRSYQMYCNKMPVICFDLFINLSKNWKTEKHLELHDQLEYIEKCINRYPVKCYRYIRMNNYWLSGENCYFTDDVVKVLLRIYKKLKNDEDGESMNEIMDAFDKLLLTNSRVVNNALEKMEA